MSKTVLAVLLVTVGLLFGCLACVLAGYIQRRRARTKKAKAKEPVEVKPETMKRIVWACIINGFAWVWCSYVLAFLERTQIAESLSQIALAEIIIPVFVYAGKSLFENLSKHNHWPDKAVRKKDEPQDPDCGDPPPVGP